MIARNAPQALELLWAVNFFQKRKALAEIKLELEKQGYNFSDQNLSMALSNSKFLTRKGKRGSFTYVQKHPYDKESK